MNNLLFLDIRNNFIEKYTIYEWTDDEIIYHLWNGLKNDESPFWINDEWMLWYKLVKKTISTEIPIHETPNDDWSKNKWENWINYNGGSIIMQLWDNWLLSPEGYCTKTKIEEAMRN